MKSHKKIEYSNGGQKNKKAYVTAGENPAKNFEIIAKVLNDYARTNNIPVIEAFDPIIENLEDKELIDYLKKVKNTYEKKDSQDKKNKEKQAMQNRWDEIKKEIDEAVSKGKSNEIDVIDRIELDTKQDSGLSSKEKKNILKRLAERKREIEAREVEKTKAKQAMEEIEGIVDREFAEGNIESRAMYLKSIESEVKNTDKIEGEAKEHLLEMISARQKEEIYYEQVEHFTNGFQFLSEYPELIDATSGFRKRKFTDREAYDRFCSLRTLLQLGISEYSQINKLLEDKSISDTDKRILEARKSVMDKEIARKREIEGR